MEIFSDARVYAHEQMKSYVQNTTKIIDWLHTPSIIYVKTDTRVYVRARMSYPCAFALRRFVMPEMLALYQCPYERSRSCNMAKPCCNCETFRPTMRVKFDVSHSDVQSILDTADAAYDTAMSSYREYILESARIFGGKRALSRFAGYHERSLSVMLLYQQHHKNTRSALYAMRRFAHKIATKSRPKEKHGKNLPPISIKAAPPTGDQQLSANTHNE